MHFLWFFCMCFCLLGCISSSRFQFVDSEKHQWNRLFYLEFLIYEYWSVAVHDGQDSCFFMFCVRVVSAYMNMVSSRNFLCQIFVVSTVIILNRCKVLIRVDMTLWKKIVFFSSFLYFSCRSCFTTSWSNWWCKWKLWPRERKSSTSTLLGTHCLKDITGVLKYPLFSMFYGVTQKIAYFSKECH